MQGEVPENLPGALFRVRIENGRAILGYIWGRRWRRCLRVLPGDKVTVQLTPYDLTKARIVFRTR